MTPEAMALLVASCGLSLPPGITAERLATIAAVESGGRVDAVSPLNRNGTRDYGLLQLNARWIGEPGFPRTAEEALRPCPNIAAGVRILAEADRAAACIYNTGKPGCRNGYPEKIQAAAAAPAAGRRAPRVAVAEPARPSPATAPDTASWDTWAVPLHEQEARPEPPEDDGTDAPASGERQRVVAEKD